MRSYSQKRGEEREEEDSLGREGKRGGGRKREERMREGGEEEKLVWEAGEAVGEAKQGSDPQGSPASRDWSPWQLNCTRVKLLGGRVVSLEAVTEEVCAGGGRKHGQQISGAGRVPGENTVNRQWPPISTCHR